MDDIIHDPVVCGLTIADERPTCRACAEAWDRDHADRARAQREWRDWSERERQRRDADALSGAIDLPREQLRRALLDLLADDIADIAAAVAGGAHE